MPDVVDAVSGDVTRFGVFGPSVERLGLIGPLLSAIIARHDGPITRCLGVRTRRERRPVGGAWAIAI
jgi:hypothetical protein